MGRLRLDKIRRVHINSFIQKRQAEGISGRPVNIDIIGLQNVLNRAVDDDWLKVLPTQNLRPLKHTTPTRELVTMEEIKRICEAGIKVSKNGEQFADYIRLMSYCGARRDEALRLKWSDVNW